MTDDSPEIRRRKEAIRERVWARMEQEGVARFPGASGRIPNFVGAERAAEMLAQTDAWRRAGVVKANPDAPQLPVRARALAEGKLVYMAVPRLAHERPFIRLDPGRIDVAPRKAASIRGAARAGEHVFVDDVKHVDMVVCGSVTVARDGARLGKGGGYSDLEYALLWEAKIVDRSSYVVTTVHRVQIWNENLPETEHDFRVDAIVTSDEVIECAVQRRPGSILWDDLDEQRLASIPALSQLR